MARTSNATGDAGRLRLAWKTVDSRPLRSRLRATRPTGYARGPMQAFLSWLRSFIPAQQVRREVEVNLGSVARLESGTAGVPRATGIEMTCQRPALARVFRKRCGEPLRDHEHRVKWEIPARSAVSLDNPTFRIDAEFFRKELSSRQTYPWRRDLGRIFVKLTESCKNRSSIMCRG